MFCPEVDVENNPLPLSVQFGFPDPPVGEHVLFRLAVLQVPNSKVCHMSGVMFTLDDVTGFAELKKAPEVRL